MNTEQVTPNVTYNEKRIEMENIAIEHQLWRCCLNCIDFYATDEQCSRFKSKPPADVIVTGCKHWDADIPF
jgi:hypothetical protein